MSTNQHGLSDESDWSDKSDGQTRPRTKAEHSPSWGRWRGLFPLSPCEFQNFLCVYCKQGFISYQYLCTVENIKRINDEN